MAPRGAGRRAARGAGVLAGVVATLLLAGCGGADHGGREPAAGPPAIAFEAPRGDLFTGHRRALGEAFNAVAADMDRDGDADLLINWHILAPLELFENVGGSFRLLNRGGDDATGLAENRGIPWLYGRYQELLPRAVDSGRPGVYVWHAEDRRRMWHLVVVFEPQPAKPVSLLLEGNRPIERIARLEESEIERLDPFRLRVRLAASGGHRYFKVKQRSVATQLVLTVEGERPLAGPGFFVGSDLVPVASNRLELWKPDPHGIAWVDVAGSPLPDLFITRGGIQGSLRPPHDPKTDRLYIAGDGPPVTYRRVAPGVVPPGYGRGRQVEWVDVDGDGRCELYIGNRATPNTLLAWDPATEVYRDVAPAAGLDFEWGATFAWLDLDGDGDQDLVASRGAAIEVARNLGGRRFERSPGSELGLELPAGDGLARLELRPADLDNDGRLDLIARGGGRLFLFLRDGERFVDATAARGLAGVAGTGVLLLVDADNDGREDLVAAGRRLVLLVNRGAAGFVERELAPGWPPTPIHAGAVLDADGDGLADLVLVGAERSLLRNATSSPGRLLEVELEGGCGAAVGALVRALYRDGSARAQRWGSAASAAYCQAEAPLRFGIPRGTAIEAVEVTWPGGGPVSRHPVARAGGILRLSRPPRQR